MTKLLPRYLADFNADYLSTPANRRRTLTLAALFLAWLFLGPGLERVMGW